MSLAKRIRRNLQTVLSAELLIATTGLATTLVNARYLGAEGLGIIVLIQVIPGLIRQIITLDLWQPIVALGSKSIVESNSEKLSELATKSIAVEIVETFVASSLSVLAVYLFAGTLGLSGDFINSAYFYAFALTLVWSSTATGVLRLFDEFQLVARVSLAGSALLLFSAVLLGYANAGVESYVYVTTAVMALQSLVTNYQALRLLLKFGCEPKLKNVGQWRGELSRTLGSFASATFGLNLINTLRQNLDAVILGYLFGPSSVGYYNIAQRFSSLATRLNMPLQYVVYPEIARLTSQRRWRKVRQLFLLWCVAGSSAAVAICAAAFPGSLALDNILGGPQFQAVAAPFLWLCSAYAVSVSGFHFRPIALNTVGPRTHLLSYFLGFFAYLPVSLLLLPLYGPLLSGAGQLAFNLAWFLTNFIVISKFLRVRSENYRTTYFFLANKLRVIRSSLRS